MSKYGPVLGKHYLKEVNDNRQYLSLKIQNEFIHIEVNHMKENILDCVWKANYSVIMLDSMPDILHTDQMIIYLFFFKIEELYCELNYLIGKSGEQLHTTYGNTGQLFQPC